MNGTKLYRGKKANVSLVTGYLITQFASWLSIAGDNKTTLIPNIASLYRNTEAVLKCSIQLSEIGALCTEMLESP